MLDEGRVTAVALLLFVLLLAVAVAYTTQTFAL